MNRLERPVDVLAILRALTEFEVDFVVIGAVAVARHGFVRATKDVDIVPNPASDSLENLLRALRALDASPLELQDFRREELPVELTVENLALGGNWAFSTKHGRLDVMQYIEGALETAEITPGCAPRRSTLASTLGRSASQDTTSCST